MSDDRSPFQDVTDALTDGCGCACHTGIGYRTGCEHCSKTPIDGWGMDLRIARERVVQLEARNARMLGVLKAACEDHEPAECTDCPGHCPCEDAALCAPHEVLREAGELTERSTT